MENELILFETADKEIKLTVPIKNNTVWLNRKQLAELFGRDVKTIGKHINNALKEELDNSVVANFATTASDGKVYNVDYYNLDVIISVGYRVKSKRGTQFRIWVTGILKEYMRKGFALEIDFWENGSMYISAVLFWFSGIKTVMFFLCIAGS